MSNSALGASNSAMLPLQEASLSLARSDHGGFAFASRAENVAFGLARSGDEGSYGCGHVILLHYRDRNTVRRAQREAHRQLSR